MGQGNAHFLRHLCVKFTTKIHYLEIATEWTDESIKAYLYLYLALLSTNHSLFLK